MGETLTQQRRVSEEGPRVVKLCPKGKMAFYRIDKVFDGTLEESTG